MGQSHRKLNHVDRCNEIGTRATTLRDLTLKLESDKSHPNAVKAHRIVEHAIGHVHEAYGHQCMSDADRDHYLGMAEICLDLAEDALNQHE